MECFATLNTDALLLCNYLFTFVLLRAAWTANWLKFWNNSAQFNLLVGVFIFLIALWFLPFGTHAGLKLHPIGATLLFLVFDWQIACITLSLILWLSMRYSGLDSSVFGATGLLTVLLPIGVSWLSLRLFYRYGKPNYFGFVLWNGYVVGAMTMLLVAIVNGLFIAATGKYSDFLMLNSYWLALPIISSSEALLTGMAISGFAVGAPNAIAHFNPDVYYPKKSH